MTSGHKGKVIFSIPKKARNSFVARGDKLIDCIKFCEAFELAPHGHGET